MECCPVIRPIFEKVQICGRCAAQKYRLELIVNRFSLQSFGIKIETEYYYVSN